MEDLKDLFFRKTGSRVRLRWSEASGIPYTTLCSYLSGGNGAGRELLSKLSNFLEIPKELIPRWQKQIENSQEMRDAPAGDSLSPADVETVLRFVLLHMPEGGMRDAVAKAMDEGEFGVASSLINWMGKLKKEKM